MVTDVETARGAARGRPAAAGANEPWAQGGHPAWNGKRRWRKVRSGGRRAVDDRSGPGLDSANFPLARVRTTGEELTLKINANFPLAYSARTRAKLTGRKPPDPGGVAPSRPRLLPGGHGAVRIGDPLAPRAGVQRRRVARQFQRQYLVGGGYARAAVGADCRLRGHAGPPEALRSRSAGRNRPAWSTLPSVGWFLAPGMCPATGSIGSRCPLKSSGARASSSTPLRASRPAPSASTVAMAPGEESKSPA